MKKNIGIVTWYKSINYGSQLQAYALSNVLKSLGYKASFISLSHHPLIKSISDWGLYHTKVFNNISLKRLSGKMDVFTKRYLRESYLSVTNPSFGKYTAIICGSDQIWAPNQYNSFYMLGFVPDEVNKISYAASIGFDDIPDNLVPDYKKYIGRINHVSVREDKGQYLLKEKCGIDSTVVLDPTLLVRKEEWDKIKVPSSIKSKYIFCYFLKKNHQYKKIVRKYAEDNQCEIYGVSDNEDDSLRMHILSHQQIGPSEFIGLIDGAYAVITDSYHGTIFSMLYHKKFVLFERFSHKDAICQNSRIEMLKKYFGIDDSVFGEDAINNKNTPPNLHSLEYDKFEKQLQDLRLESTNYLKNAIKARF